MVDRLRIAVVGSGPSGVYSAETVTKKADAFVDVFERLPAPYGLLRYGVAPDHVKIKALATAMARVFDRPDVRFLGGVELGVDVSAEELSSHYDAVIYAIGAPADRRLGIPGEELAGSLSASALVSWYSGHPDAGLAPVHLDSETAVIFGMGNVALDIARLLTRPADQLRSTDVPDHVLAALAESKVRDVHVVGRRGPLAARFSTKELRELNDVEGVQLLAYAGEIDADDQMAAEGEPARNLELFREWSLRPKDKSRRRIHFRFGLQPDELLGTDHLHGVRLCRVAPDPAGHWRRTGDEIVIDAQLAVRSIGYRGVAIPGVPFDERNCVIPNDAGRVRGSRAGEYVVGWAKRGPTGVIGTNKADALETVATLLDDRVRLPGARVPDPDAILTVLAARGVRPISWQGWQGIDAAEIRLGAGRGAARVKIHHREGMLAAAMARIPA